MTDQERTKGEIEFWWLCKKLKREVMQEFHNRQPEYGDIWLDLDLETLCGQVRAEANRIRPEMEKENLRHRIVDTVAYLAMLYRLTEDRETVNITASDAESGIRRSPILGKMEES